MQVTVYCQLLTKSLALMQLQPGADRGEVHTFTNLDKLSYDINHLMSYEMERVITDNCLPIFCEF